jgi:hypothetical protein
MRKRTVTVNDTMQRGYRYQLVEPAGQNFDPEFHPGLTPKQMLQLGVFGGKYMTDARAEFPNSWFAGAKLATAGRDSSLNYFGVHASQPLSTWRKNGWIHPDDPRGWFQWYCRYYMGRRTPEEDHRRSAVGKQCDGTSGKLSVTANQAIRCAVSGNARRFYTGRTTAEQFEFCSTAIAVVYKTGSAGWQDGSQNGLMSRRPWWRRLCSAGQGGPKHLVDDPDRQGPV